MAERLHFAVPGDPGAASGGYRYDRRIAEALGARGWSVSAVRLDAAFPSPSAAALADAAARLAAIGAGERVLIDGLALGAMPQLALAEAQRLRLIALVHHPLALETGLAPARAEALRAAERAALTAVRLVVATSAATARLLSGDFAVPAARIAVVEPGTDPAPLARGSGGAVPELLCVGALIPRKGHELLLAALARLADRPWHLTLVGSTARDPATAEALAAQIRRLCLGERVRVAGELDEAGLADAYAAADLFVLPSRFEGYGMAYAEALARGLPVLGTRAGAIPETVPDDAGLLVAPGSTAALAEALARLLDDAGLRARLAAGARRARRGLPDWPSQARRLAGLLADV